MNHPVLQWQLIAPNPEAAAAFYRRAFGWTIDAANALGYRQITAEAGGIGGGIWPAPPGATAFVQIFVGCDDVAATLARATEAGAQVVLPVTPLPDGDVMAIVRDPAGVSIGLVKAPA